MYEFGNIIALIHTSITRTFLLCIWYIFFHMLHNDRSFFLNIHCLWKKKYFNVIVTYFGSKNIRSRLSWATTAIFPSENWMLSPNRSQPNTRRATLQFSEQKLNIVSQSLPNIRWATFLSTINNTMIFFIFYFLKKLFLVHYVRNMFLFFCYHHWYFFPSRSITFFQSQ